MRVSAPQWISYEVAESGLSLNTPPFDAGVVAHALTVTALRDLARKCLATLCVEMRAHVILWVSEMKRVRSLLFSFGLQNNSQL
jgi:hypothetical protein